jgi:Kef-type K+ transport system membrane component KefB
VIPVILLLCVGGLMHAVRSYTGGTSAGGAELAFGYLLLAAFFTGKIVNRFGMPKLTGYIIAGVISGEFVLNLVDLKMNGSLKVVSNLATCILALTAGSELNLKRLKPVMATLRAMTLFAVVGAQLAIATMLFLLGMVGLVPFLDNLTFTQSLAACFVIGVALSAQSPAVMMAILSETGAEGPLSQVMLGSVVLADFVVLFMFSAASSLATAVIGGGVDVFETTLSVSWELLGSVVFGIAIGMLIARYLISVKHGSTLFAVMVCVIVAEIGTRIHLDSLIVMLAAGIWLENFSKAKAHDLLHGLQSAELPVFLVFFALAGGKIHLDELGHSIIPVVIIAITRAATFYFGSKAACVATGARPEVAKYAWFGLVPQSGLALALALLILATFPKPMFGEAASVIVFGVVAVNEVISPVILRAMIMRSGEAGRREAVKLGH